MSSLPYIQIWIGDWERDVNLISLESEAALLKLTFKLHQAKANGILECGFSLHQLSLLFKKSLAEAEQIVRELHVNNILDIEFLPEKRFKFVSRRMVKDAAKSLTNSKNGKEGGRGKSKSKAKSKRNPGIGSDNGNGIDNDVDVSIWPSFDDFWDAYDKKVGRDKCEGKWEYVSQSDREKIMAHIPLYKDAQPNKKYRKNPETYFNNKSWNDEIIISNEQGTTKNGQQPGFHPGAIRNV